MTAATMLFVGYKPMKIPMETLSGMLAGLQTHAGYAMVYPVAIILKIVLAQLVLSALSLQ